MSIAHNPSDFFTDNSSFDSKNSTVWSSPNKSGHLKSFLRIQLNDKTFGIFLLFIILSVYLLEKVNRMAKKILTEIHLFLYYSAGREFIQ